MYLFLERGEGREKVERNINVWLPVKHPPLGTWPATQVPVLTGNRTGDPLVRRLALNPLSHASWEKLLKHVFLSFLHPSLNPVASLIPSTCLVILGVT